MKSTSAVKWICLSMVLMFLGGCETVKKGTDKTVGYVRGEYRNIVGQRVDKACSATLRAIDDLELKLISQQCDALTGEIVARNARDEKITIGLLREDARLTRITIQVGAFGDKELSSVIFGRIKDEL